LTTQNPDRLRELGGKQNILREKLIEKYGKERTKEIRDIMIEKRKQKAPMKAAETAVTSAVTSAEPEHKPLDVQADESGEDSDGDNASVHTSEPGDSKKRKLADADGKKNEKGVPKKRKQKQKMEEATPVVGDGDSESLIVSSKAKEVQQDSTLALYSNSHF
jgi:hypothetical protein